MQSNTDSTTVARVKEPHNAHDTVPGPAGLVAAFIVAGLFIFWLGLDLRRERQWFAERKRRMEHFRSEARRRHEALTTAILQERLVASAAQIIPPASAAQMIKTTVELASKKRKIFKLYG
jgi:hypothetical protein